MSHFTVMVRLPAEVQQSKVEDTLAAVLFPYKETGAMDEAELKRAELFVEFEDTEEENRKKYAEEAVECVVVEKPTRAKMIAAEMGDAKAPAVVRDVNGAVVKPGIYSKYEDRFRTFKAGIGISSNDKYEAPPGAVMRKVPHRERFKTFGVFMKEYCEEEVDEKTGRYGYWHNPKGYWDWYAVGGRWRGKILIKPGARQVLGELPHYASAEERRPVEGSDIARISDIDWDAVAVATRKEVEEFWVEVPLFLGGKKYDFMDGPRETLLKLGVLDCIDEKDLKGNESWKSKWQNADRYDVIAKAPTREEYGARVEARFNKLRTFAFVDPVAGWTQPGKMGWWAMSDEQPENIASYDIKFGEWLKSGDQRDWVVVVDCHV